jgi:hypothetical protein
MLHQNTNLFLPEHLANAKRMSELAETDREALRVVADWTKTFVAKPHSDLGRSGPLDHEDWFRLWAHRYADATAGALAEELRRLPWRAATEPCAGPEPSLASQLIGRM